MVVEVVGRRWDAGGVRGGGVGGVRVVGGG